MTERRTIPDFAAQMKHLCDELYPDAEVIRVVLDNPNTHAFGSLSATYPPDEAWRRRRKLEFHFTPKHASWLTMAECELSVLAGQCLDRRIASRDELAAEVAAWQAARNAASARIDWTFRVADARRKLDHLYPKELVRCGTSGPRREFATVVSAVCKLVVNSRSGAMQKRHVVELTDDERSDLTGRFAGRLTLREPNRVRILLGTDAGDTDEEVADAVGVCVAAVAHVRKRFAADGLAAALGERPRSGGPPKFDGEVEAAVVAVACSPTPGGQATWTVRLIADRLVELHAAEAISARTVGRVLKKVGSSRGRRRRGACPAG